jgi:hypothetical protein
MLFRLLCNNQNNPPTPRASLRVRSKNNRHIFFLYFDKIRLCLSQAILQV